MAWRLLLNAARDTSTQGADLGSTSGLAGCVAMFDSAVIEANLVLAAPLSTSNLKDLSAAHVWPKKTKRNGNDRCADAVICSLSQLGPIDQHARKGPLNPSLFYRV